MSQWLTVKMLRTHKDTQVVDRAESGEESMKLGTWRCS